MKKLLLVLTALLCLSCGDTPPEVDAMGINTLMAAPSFTYTPCSPEWTTCKFTGTQTIRYGATVNGVDHYVTKVLTSQNGAGISCTNNTFGSDPAPTVTKNCSIQNAVVAPPVVDASAPPTDTATYTKCGTAYNWCSFGSKPVAASVRFGSDQGGWTPVKAFPAGYGTQCNWNNFAAKDPCPTCQEICQVVTGVPPVVPVKDASVPPVVVVDAAVPKDASTPPVVVDASPPPVVVPPIVVPPTTGNRPSASKGVGFYVLNGKLFDANDKEFRMRGTNKTHQDNQSPGLAKAGSNATRWIVYFTEQPDRTIQDLQSPTIGGSAANKAVQIPGFWDATCSNDITKFNTAVDRWVRDAAKYQAIEKFTILNVANEALSGLNQWQSAYMAALPRIRAAGWHGTIMVDAPGCGQSGDVIAQGGQAVLAADPEHNVLFSWHVYGNVYDSQSGMTKQWTEQVDLVPTLQAIKAAGLTVVIGEFGPGRNVGPSPTMLTPKRLIQVAEANGIGWLSWSWDDNNLSGGMSDDNSFSHSYSGSYNSSADLTTFGKIIVEDPEVGWKAIAKPASIFQ